MGKGKTVLLIAIVLVAGYGIAQVVSIRGLLSGSADVIGPSSGTSSQTTTDLALAPSLTMQQGSSFVVTGNLFAQEFSSNGISGPDTFFSCDPAYAPWNSFLQVSPKPGDGRVEVQIQEIDIKAASNPVIITLTHGTLGPQCVEDSKIHLGGFDLKAQSGESFTVTLVLSGGIHLTGSGNFI